MKTSKPLIDNSQILPNPNKIPIILFDDPKKFTQKSFTIKKTYPVATGIHTYARSYQDLFIASLSEDGLYSFSKQSGKLLFKYERPKNFGYLNHLIINNLLIYTLFSTTDDSQKIVGYLLENGKEEWSYSLDIEKSSHSFMEFEYHNDNLVLLKQQIDNNDTYPSVYNYLAIDIHNGKLLWRSEKPGRFLVDDNGQLIFSINNRLVKYDSQFQSVLWQSQELPSSISVRYIEDSGYKISINSKEADRNKLFLLAGDTLADYGYLIDTSNGKVIKKGIQTSYTKDFNFKNSNHASNPVFYNNRFILQISDQDTLSCFDIYQMTEVWRLQLNIKQYLGDVETDSWFGVKPWIYENKLFINYKSTNKDIVYCIKPENGNILWIKPFNLDDIWIGNPIRENRNPEIDSFKTIAKSLTFIDFQNGNELWNLQLTNQYYCSFYIPFKDFYLFAISVSDNGKPKNIGILKVLRNGTIEGIYESDLGGVDYFDEFSCEDESSLIFGGEFNNSSCYFEVDKNSFGK